MTKNLSRGALRTSLALAALLAPLATTDSLLAQSAKRAVTHDDYDQWTSLSGTTYSDDGKWKGTAMVYEAFCRWSGIEPKAFEMPAAGHELTVADAGPDTLDAALEAACFVPRHDREMRALAGLNVQDRAAGFDRIRREYPPRRDFHAWRVDCSHPETAQLLENIGFFVRRV